MLICILKHELRRLLAMAGLPVAVAEFRHQRSGESAKTGCGFIIEFPEAVAGPVTMDEASHFGMGGFEVEGLEIR